MKRTKAEQIQHVAKCQDCDWAVDDAECVPKGSRHAKQTGHHVVIQTGYHYEYNGHE